MIAVLLRVNSCLMPPFPIEIVGTERCGPARCVGAVRGPGDLSWRLERVEVVDFALSSVYHNNYTDFSPPRAAAGCCPAHAKKSAYTLPLTLQKQVTAFAGQSTRGAYYIQYVRPPPHGARAIRTVEI